MKAIGALLVLALVAGDPALAARKKKGKKGRASRPAAAAPARATPPPPSVRQGVELWRASKWDAAVSMWQPFAQDGDADAMFNMGQAYKLGRGVAQDKAIAQDWYRRAAVKGHLPAQANLGILLFQATEKAEAVRWLKAAADKGEMRAQYVLGIVHWNGDGAAKSLPLAYAYLVRAAAQGLPEATKALNELSQVIQPLDRANGWQIATALANGSGVPAQFQPGIQPPPMMAVTTPPPAIVVASAAAAAPASGTSTAALNAAALKAAAGDAGEGDTEEEQDAPAADAPGRQPGPAASTPPLAPPAARPSRTADAAAEKQAAAEAAAEKRAADKRAAERKLAAQKAAEAARETGWRIQLGTYPNQKSAMQAWTKLAASNRKATRGLRPVIGKFGGNYRLQVGPFPTRDEARDGCKTLEIGKNGCFALNID
ncbi:SPOR domain-containing protein [Sandarakinorhabdus sp. AAP62]|uniref:SPOR domain-containing protein n=1 Tax=Sandarakinorhabdus sp. AAP62 TaxID=1248916 RepID=UPI00037CF15F|nr:SPOR domain-containing protein [Sandarakinorhabdus sp. AAP62]